MSFVGNRLRPENRLNKAEDYKQVFSSKRRSSDKSFLFLAKSNDDNIARLGLAVPKKHINSAVERNKLKRKIRESFRLKHESLNGNDIVVVIRNKMDVNDKNIESILESHWVRVIK